MKPIVFAGLGDGYNSYPGRQRLLHALAAYTPVIYIRSPTKLRLKSILPQLVQIEHNTFEVVNSFALSQTRIGRRVLGISSWIDAQLLKCALNRGGFSDVLVWLAVPDPRLIRCVRSSRIIYDCVDPCFLPDQQADFDRREAHVIARATVVFCTAHLLLESATRKGKKAFLLPNGCELTPLVVAGILPELPGALRKVSQPIVGYMGTIDWRFDTDLVIGVANILKQFTFVIVGRINSDQEERVSKVSKLPNVILTGAVDVRLGDAYTRLFDVAIIPFTEGAMNDAINPVKVYMHLACGTPTVATAIRECLELAPLVRCASGPQKIAEAIVHEHTSNNELRRQERIKFAEENTWNVRATQALQVLNEHSML